MNTDNMTPSYGTQFNYNPVPLEGRSAPDKSKHEAPQSIQAESLRPVTSVLVDLGAFNVVLKALQEQQEKSLASIQRLEEQVKSIEELLSGTKRRKEMEIEIEQQKQSLNEKGAEIAELKRKIAELQPAPEGVVHPSGYRLFGMTLENINNAENKFSWPFVRTWSTFMEWSESPDVKVDQFTAEFRKVDTTLLKLKINEEHRKALRRRVSEEIETTVSRSLFARFSVSWDFEGQTIDSAKQFSAGGGQKIAFVKSALIMQDGKIIDKAEVECQ